MWEARGVETWYRHSWSYTEANRMEAEFSLGLFLQFEVSQLIREQKRGKGMGRRKEVFGL